MGVFYLFYSQDITLHLIWSYFILESLVDYYILGTIFKCKQNYNLNIIGLMCIPPNDGRSEQYFNEMYKLNKKYNFNDLLKFNSINANGLLNNDLNNTSIDYGIFVSLTSPIMCHRRLEYKELNGKHIIFIPNSGFDSLNIIYGVLFLRHIYSMNLKYLMVFIIYTFFGDYALYLNILIDLVSNNLRAIV